MKVSLYTIQQLVDFELPPVQELVARVNSQLGGVEEIIDLGAKYSDALIVIIAGCKKHPNADKLSVCMIDDGGAVKDIQRDEFGLIQVVCGAPNVRGGMVAVWLPPGATVPSSYDEAKPFVLDTREIRGVLSNGMLAAADELGIGTDHSGIVELTVDDFVSDALVGTIRDSDLAETTFDNLLGTKFADVFGLTTHVIDIENKMFTHRPDLFGQLGVAREIAGIYNQRFEEPSWYDKVSDISHASTMKLSVHNECPEAAPRFMAVCMDKVKVGESPMWLKTALVAMGGKPINNVVDITNYMMFLTGQPTHAYDYDKLQGSTLGVRYAKDGEKVSLLNGKSYQLQTDDIVIVDGDGPVGLAGVMGGSDSEVSASTSRVVIECATFDMYTIRRMSMRYGLFTDAVTRFNKGQSPEVNEHVLQRLMAVLSDVTGAQAASKIFDVRHTAKQHASDAVVSEVMPMKDFAITSATFVNNRLGSSLTRADMTTLLENVGFDIIAKDKDSFAYKAPAWRTDIHDPEDIVEEVGRLYGFDKLPKNLPIRTAKPTPTNAAIELKKRIRDSMKRHGANEVLTYSFVHEKVIVGANQDLSQAFRLGNALSPELQYYRLSVLPSLLDKVHMNIKSGHDEFVLYEIGKGHNKKYHYDDDSGLPAEMGFVDGVYASKKPRQGAAFYYMRRLVSQLLTDLGSEVVFEPADSTLDYPVTAPFDLARSAMVTTTSGVFVGMVGELKPSTVRNFKLPEYSAAMTLDFAGLTEATQAQAAHYYALSRYPSITQDISLRVSKNVSYADVYGVTLDTLSLGDDIRVNVDGKTIYQAQNDTTEKTITLRIEVTHYKKTLTDKDVSRLLDKVAAKAHTKLKAERI